ncbi:MAG: prepilin-type N-terminal cleavage/methylation domain-containing protein [Halofilum sp. (in: g-proteobacteria)]|nr:prepilin-type N-terminal cleavage/methylation domain-containing protein [Halofilum sp. (in: g-proteobacteria)]
MYYQTCAISIPTASLQAANIRPRGFSLIESIIALVVIAAAATGVLLIYAEATSRSADPMLRAQAQSIAIGYMDEILLQSYDDPDGGETGGAEAGETRSTFDDVWDYDTINGEVPTARDGNPIGALNDYSVDVTVTGGPPAVVTVTVTHDSARVNYELVSEREDY